MHADRIPFGGLVLIAHFIIAKAGKPMVKVVPLNAPESNQLRRLGFMMGQIKVPDDFDRMSSTEIEKLFGDEA